MIDIKYYTKYFNRNFQPIDNNSTSWIPSGASTFIDFTQGKIYIKRPYQIDTAYPPFYGDIHSFVRSGSRAATRADGSVQIFPTGVPRITDLGLRVTAGATNLLTYSEDFSNADWYASSANNGVGPVKTPFEGFMRIRLEAPESGDSSGLFQSNTGDIVQGAPHVCKVRVRASAVADVGKQILFRHAGRASYGVITLTEDWQDAVSVENALNANSYLAFELRPQIDGSAGVVTFDVQRAQLETGSVATDYIPTADSSASAGADQYTLTDLDALGLTSAVLAAGYTVLVEATPGPSSSASVRGVISLNNGTLSEAVDIRQQSGVFRYRVASADVNSVFMPSTIADTIGVSRKMAWSLASARALFSVDGETPVEDTSVVMPTVSRILLGALDSDVFPSDGFIRSVTIIPTPVDDATLQALSGS